MDNFRVTLFLNHFFSDQRASCRVYITSHMKTIQDLLNHINEIFCLDKDFYLISDNLYLPNAEDIRVLKEDDVVVAVPAQLEETISKSNQIQNNKPVKRKRNSLNNDAELEINNSLNKKEKKCKKSKLENNDCIKGQQVEETEVIYVDCSKTKKKSKTKSSNEDTYTENNNNKKDANENRQIETNGEEINSVVKIPKKKKNENKSDKINQEGFVKDLKKIETDEFNKKNKISQEPSVSLSSTYPSPSLKLLSKPRNIQLMEISRSPKIVKTIHVYDRKSLLGNEISNIENPNENNCIASSTPVKVTPSVVHNFKDERNEEFFKLLEKKSKLFASQQVVSSNEEIKEKLEDLPKTVLLNSDEVNSVNIVMNDSVATVLNEDDDKELLASSNEASENKNVLVLNDIRVHPPASECIPNKEPATSSILSNEDCSESVASLLTEDDNFGFIKSKRKRKRTRKKKVKPVECTIPNILIPIIGPQPETVESSSKHIRFLDDEGEILENKQIQQQVDDADNTVNKKHVDEVKNDCQKGVEGLPNNLEVIEDIISPLGYEILLKEKIGKFPIMSDIFPKRGDIIAFKIFILSEYYTPELSDFIIAKVEDYNTDNKIVFVKIIVGGEQCVEPEGKFSIEIEEKPKQQKPDTVRYFSWEALKEPRLLFP